MQGVWASKYNERAFLSMKKVGLNFLDLRMAVLVQRVVPAAYAFVIHTENPTNGAKDEIFAELVAGLGESIVSGMVPGSSLSFYAKKDALDKPEVGIKTHAVTQTSMLCMVATLQASYARARCSLDSNDARPQQHSLAVLLLYNSDSPLLCFDKHLL